MRMRRAAAALAIATVTCSPQHPAVAEPSQPPHCAPYADVSEMLRQRFGETLRFRAEENRGFALEFFAHDDGSWTLVMRQDDRACAIAAGTAWRKDAARENTF